MLLLCCGFSGLRLVMLLAVVCGLWAVVGCICGLVAMGQLVAPFDANGSSSMHPAMLCCAVLCCAVLGVAVQLPWHVVNLQAAKAGRVSLFLLQKKAV
jgi:hypothetical protein